VKVPARLRWAVELLDVGSAERILEIGCGPGVAAALVCERLQGGRLTAIDRSPTAIERTRARNADHVAAGRLVVHGTTLASLTVPPAQLDKAFAVNVNLFWTGPAGAECAVLGRGLRPGGVLRLVYDAPPRRGGRDVVPLVAATLEGHGFTTRITRHAAGAMACVTAVRPDRP
jgi:SAM-dependent methyltransferase